MAKDEAKNLGYHWRRAAGVYDKPGRKTKGSELTTSADIGGLTGTPQKTSSSKK